MRYCLNVVYGLALFLLLPWLIYRALRTGRYRQGLTAKLFGRQTLPDVSGCVWFHGVSVGEVHLLRQVLATFHKRFPERKVVVSTTTDTGYAEAKRCFPDGHVIYFPFDFTWAVGRTLDQLRPSLVVLVESEIWPNFLMTAKKKNVPVALINGRMSPRSFRRFHRVKSLASGIFDLFAHIGVQSEEYADHLRRLGVDSTKIHVTGNVKYDGVTGDRTNERTTQFRDLFGIGASDVVWVAGSTQAPEEEIVLRVYARLQSEHASLRLILVPRHPERFDEVASVLEQSGLPFVRRSALHEPLQERRIVLGDTMGELSAVWGLADLAFVGGSLDGSRGGQNMIEPSGFGSAVLFGPHTWNFREATRQLLDREAAIRVEDEESLYRAMRTLLRDTSARIAMGERAREYVLSQQGATQRTVELLGRLISTRTPSGRVA